MCGETETAGERGAGFSRSSAVKVKGQTCSFTHSADAFIQGNGSIDVHFHQYVYSVMYFHTARPRGPRAQGDPEGKFINAFLVIVLF